MKKLIKPMLVISLAIFTMIGSLSAQERSTKKTTDEVTSKQEVKKSKKNAKPAEITFENVEYNYGTIQVGDNGDCEFTFKNTGKEPLVVSKVQGCCGVSVVDWTKDPVMPKKAGTVKLRYNTKRPVTINKTVKVFSNDPEKPEVHLLLKGKIEGEAAPVSRTDELKKSKEEKHQ
ncbi:DUF1573 domain-containing protein [Bacteroidales bacterium OttesenSCG-928-L14]|nr:DUF1573 domain-containing protein [Bacteroidales bacterium OttesenSCG-928-L14]